MQTDEKKPSKSSKSNDKNAKSPKKNQPTAVVKSKLRNEGRENDTETAARRKTHQKELASRRQEDGLERFSGDGAGANGKREKQWRKFESYALESQLPDAVASQKVSVFLFVLRVLPLVRLHPYERD